jgi:hypothetical protein
MSSFVVLQINYIKDYAGSPIRESAWCNLAYDRPSQTWPTLFLTLTMAFFVIPLTVLTVLYGIIGCVLYKSCKPQHQQMLHQGFDGGEMAGNGQQGSVYFSNQQLRDDQRRLQASVDQQQGERRVLSENIRGGNAGVGCHQAGQWPVTAVERKGDNKRDKSSSSKASTSHHQVNNNEAGVEMKLSGRSDPNKVRHIHNDKVLPLLGLSQEFFYFPFFPFLMLSLVYVQHLLSKCCDK